MVNNTNQVSATNLSSMTEHVKRPSGQHHGDLRRALEEAALELVVTKGVGGFSMAEASRRAGVSVAAPYKHYADPLEAASTLGFGHWAVSVRDLDTAFAAVVAAGGTPVWPPAGAVQPGARFAYVKDPEGNLIELVQPPAR